MADKEINDLTDGGAVANGDLVHVVRSGNSRKVTLKPQLPTVLASSSGPASIELAEDTDNGSHKVTLIAPASLAADATVTLPGATGTLLNDPLTTRGDMIRRGASATERFAKGTAGQVLTMGADDPVWADVAMPLLASRTISSAVAQEDIDISAFTGFRALKLVLEHIVPATDDAFLSLRVSTDGGSNYASTGYINQTLVNASLVTLTTGINLVNPNATGGVSNVAAEGGWSGEVMLFKPDSAAYRPQFKINGVYIPASAVDLYAVNGGGYYNTAQDTDHLRLLFNTGNIASGSWSLYGIR